MCGYYETQGEQVHPHARVRFTDLAHPLHSRIDVLLAGWRVAL